MRLKNVFHFLGFWSYPLGLTVSGMFAYLSQTMQMQEFNLNRENLFGVLAGGLAVPGFIVFSNLFDFISKGRTDFAPNLTGKKDVTRISESKKQAMYKKIGDRKSVV